MSKEGKKPPLALRSETSFIAPSVLAGKTSVKSQDATAKLDLERKIIRPATPQKVAEITRIITSQGGEIITSKSGMIVAHIPKESEESINASLLTTKSTTSTEVDYPIF